RARARPRHRARHPRRAGGARRSVRAALPPAAARARPRGAGAAHRMSSIAAAPARDDRPGERGADWRLGRRLLVYLVAHPGLLLLSLVLYPLAAASVVAPPYIVRQILDQVIPSHDVSRLGVFALLYLVALALEYVTDLASQLALGVL